MNSPLDTMKWRPVHGLGNCHCTQLSFKSTPDNQHAQWRGFRLNFWCHILQ